MSVDRLTSRAKTFCRGTRLNYLSIRKILESATNCGYCGKPIDAIVKTRAKTALELDHKNPLGRGGRNLLNNIHAVCRICNRAKGSLTHEEFTELMTLLKSYPEMKERVLRRLAASKAWF